MNESIPLSIGGRPLNSIKPLGNAMYNGGASVAGALALMKNSLYDI